MNILSTALSAAAGAALSFVFLLWRKGKNQRNSSEKSVNERSTTSSAGGGAAAYETRKAVNEYLQFHFGAADELLPYEKGPKNALEFPARCAALAERFCESLRDFNGELGEQIAIDIGCAVGGATFALARAFPHVLGIDYSQAFVDAAQEMQQVGWMEYEEVVEGEILQKQIARVPEDVPRERAKFIQGDACALPADLPPCDAVLAANLVCRLPEPTAFLDRLPSLVKPGGVAVIISPHSWLSGWTAKEKWLGGKYDKAGQPIWTKDTMAAILSRHFELVHSEDMPFLIREHVRKYQWGCSLACVWRRKVE